MAVRLVFMDLDDTFVSPDKTITADNLRALDLAHERGIHFRDRLAAAPRILRWAAYEGALFLFLFMGYFLGGGGFLYAIY